MVDKTKAMNNEESIFNIIGGIFLFTIVAQALYFSETKGLYFFCSTLISWIIVIILSIIFVCLLKPRPNVKKIYVHLSRIFFGIIIVLMFVPLFLSARDIPYMFNPNSVILKEYEIKTYKDADAEQYAIVGKTNDDEAYSQDLRRPDLEFFEGYKNNSIKILYLPYSKTILSVNMTLPM